MVFEHSSVHNYLNEEFKRRVRVNSRYSLRAYARSLGLSSGALSEILNEQRPVSIKATLKISKALGLTAAETKYLLQLVSVQKSELLKDDAYNFADIDAQKKKLNDDVFHLVSEWYHFAILNLIDCEGFVWSAEFISKRLGLGLTQAKMAMKLLIDLGLVQKKGDHYKGVSDYILSPDGISSEAIRKYHRQILGKAMESLELQDVNEREATGMGFAFDTKHLPRIKKEISDFQDQLIAKYSHGKKQEVYFLETILFKLTQGKNNEKE